MTWVNIFIVGAIIIAIFTAGVWFTISEFGHIEENETERRKHLEEDMEVKDHT